MERGSAMPRLAGDLRFTAWFGSAHGLLGSPSLRLNPFLKGGYVTVCKYNGRRRRPGKSVEEKRREFETKKVELLKKSRGAQPRTKLDKNVEALGPLVVSNEYGALSVSALQPMEEGNYLAGSLRAPSFPQEGAQISGEYNSVSLNNGGGLWFSQVRTNGASMSIIEHTITPPVQEKQVSVDHVGPKLGQQQVEHTITSSVEQEQAGGSSFSENSNLDSDGEEWVEIGIEEADDDDDERVELWEGDLPAMTSEEEEELLREAELELAELEKLGEPGRVVDLEDVAPEARLILERAEVESKLADLKLLVQQMEEQLAGDDGQALQTLPGVNARTTEYMDSKLDGGVEVFSKDGMDDIDQAELDEEEFDEDYAHLSREEEQRNGSEEIRLVSNRIQLQHSRHRQDYWEEEFDDEDVKEERGVPAVMRCFDRAKIYVKAGDGGNGVVAFRREKFVPFGGPFGGTGGRGGHVYIEADSSMNSLLPFRKAVHFRAGRGSHGGGKKKEGAVGVDCIVKVPPGSLIKEPGPEGKVLLELTKPGQREMLLPGGAGGRGNAAFKTGRNNAPQLAEFGEKGAEMWIEVELKLVADVGIVGVPNAGKSTLLSAISAAKPEIANYPFTTLLPNLGVVALDYDEAMVVADLPGLLEGAHTGRGLGHEFLRHTERCKVLVHVVDGMSLQPVEELEAVRLELELFNPELSEKPFVVAFNKMDIPEAAERWEIFKQSLCSKGLEPFCMSAATKEGTSEIIRTAQELLKRQKESPMNDHAQEDENSIAVADIVAKQRSAPIEQFTINADKHTRTWQVVGAGLERFTQMTNWEYFEAVRRFQNVLSASGVNKALKEDGVQEGDTVIVGEMEFSWIDAENMSALSDWKRGTRGSKLWPH